MPQEIHMVGRPAAVAERKPRHERVLTNGSTDTPALPSFRRPAIRFTVPPIQLEHEGRKVGNE
jgi:hypothetical protein